MKKANKHKRTPTLIVLSNGLKVRLKVAAAKEQTSMSHLIERVLSQHLDRR